MAVEKGFVASIGEDGWARVVTKKSAACDRCKVSHCCASFGSASNRVVRAVNKVGACAGDLVSISLSPGMLIKGAAILYLIPVAGLISGAVIGEGFSHIWAMGENGAAALFGFAGLFLGFILTALVSRLMFAHNRFAPVITQIIRPGISSAGSSMVIDPVCKMRVNPTETSAKLIYQDKDYFFCHPRCRESFVKNPEKYL
ncbi:MAG: SoxR reducing system RseC family protein [Desulfobacteraceae bacterium]|nr:MAG: SoxR reducing system RseC family protein [Desulfobacteraceae bacterium]